MSDFDPFAPLSGDQPKQPPALPAWAPIAPIPEDAPPCPSAHPTLGSPSRHWIYLDQQKHPLCVIMRFETKPKKQFRTLTYCRSATKDRCEWRWEAFPQDRPLYRLDLLAERPDASVLFCEGEKSVDAAQRLLDQVSLEFVCMTSPNGSGSVGKADLNPLRGRRVIIWPDNDAAGTKCAGTLEKRLIAIGAAAVAIITPPDGVKEGWDAADAEEAGWTAQQAAALVASAVVVGAPEKPSPAAAQDEPAKRVRTPDALIALAQYFQFWISTSGVEYVEVRAGARRRNLPIASEAFKKLLTMKAYEATGQLPSASAIDQAARFYAARASVEGTKRQAWLRAAGAPGKVFIDLADQRGRVIEISANDVNIISGDGLPFIEMEMAQPFPEPVMEHASDSPIEELRAFLNVEGDDDFVLIVGWLVMALAGRGPYPILIVKAEHGSGKTTFAERLGSLIDPCIPKAFALPETVRDLVAIAANRRGLIFDNVSYIAAATSDALCQMAYGQGVINRRLHTDAGVNVFGDARPILINSIEDVARRPDLASRGLFVRLRPLTDAERRPDDELEREWEEARPRILGALCWAVSSILRHVEKVEVSSVGRMAQLEKFMAAAEAGLGWKAGAFAAAYARNSAISEDTAFENDLVAVAIFDMMEADRAQFWSGSASALLDKIDAVVSDKVRNSREWPRNAVSLGRAQDRCKKILRAKGFDWKRGKSGTRFHTITRIEK